MAEWEVERGEKQSRNEGTDDEIKGIKVKERKESNNRCRQGITGKGLRVKYMKVINVKEWGMDWLEDVLMAMVGWREIRKGSS